ncbi:MAG: GIY-YIG nuclease family protein [Micavibrio sp.]|nr:GIY-YIG nuclease family protein [Micavibrio sp.]
MKNILGKSIRLFLVDGSPQGLITLEVPNWTGHVLSGPRAKIAELVQRPEMQRTGVYILSGIDQDSGKPLVYIGETDNMARRIAQHNKEIDFWERGYFITSTDQNLTKAHARYIESRLISIAEDAEIAKLHNSTSPTIDRLPESDISDMEYFIQQIRLVFPVLGLDILRDKPQVTVKLAGNPASTKDDVATESPIFEIHAKKHDLTAHAREVDGDFILLAGSETQPKWIGTGDHSYSKIHQQLVTEGKIVTDEAHNKGIVREDIYFTSPSGAAAIVLGRASNGRYEWKVQGSSETYQQWQDRIVESVFD